MLATISADVARIKTDRAKSLLDEAAGILADLYEANAYQLLGYASWKAFVDVEFGKSYSWFNRKIRQHEVEQNLGFAIPERIARELSRLNAQVQVAAYSAALATGSATLGTVKHAIDEIEEVLITGVYTDDQGEQIAAQGLLELGTAGRMLEARARSLEHLNGKRNYLMKASEIDTWWLSYGNTQLTIHLPDDIDMTDIIEGRKLMMTIWIEDKGDDDETA